MDLQKVLGEYRELYKTDSQAENWEAAAESAEVVARVQEYLGDEGEATYYYRLAAELACREVQEELQAGKPLDEDRLDYLLAAAWLFWKGRQPERAAAVLNEVDVHLSSRLLGIRGLAARSLLLWHLLGQGEQVKKAQAQPWWSELPKEPIELAVRMAMICVFGRTDLRESTARQIREEIEADGLDFWYAGQMLFDWLRLLEQPA